MLDRLPDEVLITIAQSVPDFTSLGRWLQTSHHYSTVLTDNLIWQSHFKRDFPTVSIADKAPLWRELYRQQVCAQQQFRREFPEFQRVGESVMPRFPQGWIDVYEQAQINPILLQPAINRICHVIRSRILRATLTFKTRPSENHTLALPITQRYLLNFGKSLKTIKYRGNVISFIITISAKVPTIRQRIGRLMDYFDRQFGLIIGINSGFDTLFFDGSLIEQSNGAHIWFPLVATHWTQYQRMTRIDTEFGQDWSKMMVIN